jgi:hypothetical protein
MPPTTPSHHTRFVAKGANVLSCDTAERRHGCRTGESSNQADAERSRAIITGDSDFALNWSTDGEDHQRSTMSCLLEKQRSMFDRKIALLRKILAG